MKRKTPWVATVLIESHGPYFEVDNKSRLKNLLEILQEARQKTKGNGIVLFPAGYFNTGRYKVNIKNCQKWINPIKRYLKTIKNRRIVACFGVDGRSVGKPIPIINDQLVYAVDKMGVIAAARKFYPTKGERIIQLAEDYLEGEGGKSRILELNGRFFYIAVCYDVFGIKKMRLQKPKVEGILNPIHKFTARCQCETEKCKCGATSGEVYFAKHGMGGGSKEWGIPVYGSVIFMGREIPKRWPWAIYINNRSSKLKTLKYEDLLFNGENNLSINYKEKF